MDYCDRQENVNIDTLIVLYSRPLLLEPFNICSVIFQEKGLKEYSTENLSVKYYMLKVR